MYKKICIMIILLIIMASYITGMAYLIEHIYHKYFTFLSPRGFSLIGGFFVALPITLGTLLLEKTNKDKASEINRKDD